MRKFTVALATCTVLLVAPAFADNLKPASPCPQTQASAGKPEGSGAVTTASASKPEGSGAISTASAKPEGSGAVTVASSSRTDCK